MEIRILGPLEVLTESRVVGLGGAKSRALLAMLVLHANEPVSAGTLAIALWGDDAPSGAARALRVQVSRLRKALGDRDVVETTAAGYRLRVDPDALDANRFERLLTEGMLALTAGRADTARTLLTSALNLWRGPPLADVAFEAFAEAETRRLQELRLTAIEARLEAELVLGHHRDVVGDLQGLVAEHPTRERLAELLMLALYRSGRQTDALEAFRRTRRTLVEDVGVEPGPALQTLQSEILNQSAALEAEPRRADGADTPVLPRALALTRDQHCWGREEELRQLQESWRRVSDATRPAVLMCGESGIGKTRLAAEFAHGVSAAGALVLFGRCDEGLAVPYQPFVEALRPYAMSVGADRLRNRLGGLASVLARLWPELYPAAPLPSADPDSERLALFDAVGAVLEQASDGQPFLLVLDDLHWAPLPTLLMLRHVIRSDRKLRMLVMATYRGEEAPAGEPLAQLLADLQREPSAARMRITGINESATAALIAGTTGSPLDERARHLALVLHEQTAGNPFFLRELVAHLEESGASVLQPQGELRLPEQLRQVIAQRVARLSEAARITLDAAAVTGPRFSWRVLERALANPSTVDALEEASSAGLLSDLGHGEYGFAHELVRQALYQTLGSARRIRFHRLIGEALEADAGAQPIEALAHHFAESATDGQTEKAAHYALAAARNAMQRLGYEEAALHCERGLSALESAAPRRERERADLLVALGEARWSIGDAAGAQSVCAEAARLAEALADPLLLGRAALGFAGPLSLSPSDEAARPGIDLLERALAAIPPGDSASALGARVMARLSADLLPGVADDRRAALARRALEIARDAGDPQTLAHTLAMEHWVAAAPDNVEDQLAIASELAAVAERIGDRRQELEARVWMLDHHLELAGADAVQLDLAGLHALTEDLNDRRARWILLVVRARQAHLAGRLAEFEDLAQEGLASSIEAGDKSGTQIYGGQMVALRREQKRLGELLNTLEGFVEHFPAVAVWRSTLAYAYGELGDYDRARDQLEPLARDQFGSIPRDTFWMSSIAMLTEVVAALGDGPRAHDLYRQLLPFADRCVVISGVLFQGAVSRLLGLLATTTDRFDEAEEHFRTAAETNARMGAHLWVLYTRYNHASMQLRRGRPTEEQQALDMLDEVTLETEQLGLEALADRARHARHSGRRITRAAASTRLDRGAPSLSTTGEGGGRREPTNL